jgi:hypothetical protein
VAKQVTQGAPYRHLVLADAGTAVPANEFELLAIAQGQGSHESAITQAVAEYLIGKHRAIVFDGKEASAQADMVAALDALLRPYFMHGRKSLQRLGGLRAQG